MASGPSLQSVKRLGEELLASKAHINNAPALLSLLSRALEPASPSLSPSSECLLQALLSLQAFFTLLLSSGELSPEASLHAKETLQHETGENADQAKAIYKSWLWDKYSEFLDSLLQMMVAPAIPPSLQVAAVDSLMGFVQQEKQGEFSNRIYSKLCSTLVFSKDFNNKMIEHLVAKYFNFIDVCCYTCINLRKIVVTRHGPKHQGEETVTSDDASSGMSLQSLMCNVCDILTCLNVPKTSGKDSETVPEIWSKPKVKGDDKRAVNAKSQQQATNKTPDKVKHSQDVKKLKSKITKAWLTFLRVPLTPLVYEKVLGHMHKAIIPNLSNPILLSDFLTNSYNKGGLISVMALSGLFSLITQYGLEYPEFYDKLYALLEPSMFIAKYRARFFELLDVSLKSPLLPSYLAAAFAKKLGRTALTSPPAGALIVIAIVHNLLRRHPSINFLVHRQDFGDAESPPESASHENVLNHKESPAGNESQGMQQAAERPGADPFNASESDLSKSNALKSSLWEMDTLRRHYCPAVSRFVASLETDLTVRAKTTEVTIKDFSSGSYATIFSEEVKRRMKQVPLAFYKSAPTILFSKASESQSPGLVDFPGWSFGCKQSCLDGKQNSSNREHSDGLHNHQNDTFCMRRNDSENEGNAGNHMKSDTTLPPTKKKKIH